MIKDYPDTMPANLNSAASGSGNSTPNHLFSTLSPPSTPTTGSPPLTPSTLGRPLPSFQAQTRTSPNAQNAPLPPPRAGPMPPPPVHPANAPLQTTYTPYIPRRRAAAASGATASARALQYATRAPDPLSPTGQQVPIITSSAQGGVTMRHPVPQPPGKHATVPKDQGPSAALFVQVRALDALPRLGELRTLDLRGNDIRVSAYLHAGALKNFLTLASIRMVSTTSHRF